MTETHSSRFKDAPWFPKEETAIIVGGAGGIGSWLSLLLSRAGFYPIVYDYDRLEEHNLAGQLYTKLDAENNTLKVDALKGLCKNFADTDITVMNERYTKDSMSHHYVMSAFDNMQARKDMFEAWCDYVREWQEENGILDITKEIEGDIDIPIFIDGRLTAEQMQIFCVTPKNISKYKEHLFDDSEVEDAPCTMKQTSHSAAMIASHMVGFFTNHMTNNAEKDITRVLPFLWEYFIPLNYINEQ